MKICGLRTEADVDCAVTAGADAIGFVLTDSPRRVTVDEATRLVAAVPPEVLSVGVFLGMPVAEVREVAAKTGLGAVQLHGRGYSAADFAALTGLGVRLVRATSTDGEPVEVGAFGEDLVILDSPRAGSGEQWTWSALRGQRGRWLLAGGLRPDNVSEAIETVQPWGLDVSSGVESARGTKDHGLIREFLAVARG